jgi:hypothetical protein
MIHYDIHTIHTPYILPFFVQNIHVRYMCTCTCVHVPHTCSGYVNLVHSYRYTRAHTLLSYVRAHSTIEMMYANKL